MSNAVQYDETDPLAFHTGDRLRKARELRGLDRTQLANELGTTRKTVAAYEQWTELKAPREQTLRHWHASTMLASGETNLRVVQEEMRHANLNTTAIYTQVTTEQMSAAVNLLPDVA